MAYKPSEYKDELGYTTIAAPRQPLGIDTQWQQALLMAKEFWETFSHTQSVSTGLRNIAQQHCKKL